MKKVLPLRSQAGFTITELMISSVAFAVLLLMLSYGIISFSNRYYRGVNVALTQGVTRSVVDTISQSIQFGTAQITPTDSSRNYFCAGGYYFIYNNAGQMFTGDTATQTGLYMTPMLTDVCSSPPTIPTSNGKQLLADRIRISRLDVQPSGTPNMFLVDLTLAYGDRDLICAPISHAGSCAAGATALLDAQLANAPDAQCRLQAGSQYCAASRLTTTVQRRVVK